MPPILGVYFVTPRRPLEPQVSLRSAPLLWSAACPVAPGCAAGWLCLVQAESGSGGAASAPTASPGGVSFGTLSSAAHQSRTGTFWTLKQNQRGSRATDDLITPVQGTAARTVADSDMLTRWPQLVQRRILARVIVRNQPCAFSTPSHQHRAIPPPGRGSRSTWTQTEAVRGDMSRGQLRGRGTGRERKRGCPLGPRLPQPGQERSGSSGQYRDEAPTALLVPGLTPALPGKVRLPTKGSLTKPTHK